METSLGGFLTFRGFADFTEIARVSKADNAYQRETIEKHISNLQDFLEKGKNLFFSEVVLGCYLPENDEEIARMAEFYSAFQENQKGNFGFRKLNIGIQAPKPYGDSTFKVATLSTIKERNDEDIFFRIDGNHRITAFEKLENKPSQVQDRIVSVCIIFFRTQEEYQKQSKMIFHNLNFKAVPLTMEQNLKLIFADEKNFPDETLKNDKSFGMPYYYAKEVSKCSFKDYFINLESLFEDNKRSSFLEFFKFLESKKIKIELEIIKANLSRVNTIFEYEILKTSKNVNLFLAFLYYHICDMNIKENVKIKKIELFQEWVLKNNIYNSKMDLESLINIFDEIYNSRIKKIFVAMPFSKEHCNNNVWNTIVEVYNELIAEGYGLSTEHTEEGKSIPYRVDKENIESGDIIERIKNNINECDLMIADLTHSRPNVYYEIGLAESKNKPLILVRDNKEQVHFDLSTKENIEYDSKDFSILKKQLKERLKNILESICEPIR